MNSGRLLPFLAIVLLTAAAVPARTTNKTADSQKITIQLASDATISNTTLTSGEYTVVVEGNQARFEKDGKVIAEAPCTWKTLSSKAPYTEVRTDQSRIKEIDISGKTQAIEFAS